MEQQQPPATVAIVDQPGYVEAFKRMLVEDALLAIAAELLDDSIAVASLQRLGVQSRLVHLLRAIMHWRANPETQAEGAMRDAMRKLPIVERPGPFNTLTPVSGGPRTS